MPRHAGNVRSTRERGGGRTSPPKTVFSGTVCRQYALENHERCIPADSGAREVAPNQTTDGALGSESREGQTCLPRERPFEWSEAGEGAAAIWGYGKKINIQSGPVCPREELRADPAALAKHRRVETAHSPNERSIRRN